LHPESLILSDFADEVKTEPWLHTEFLYAEVGSKRSVFGLYRSNSYEHVTHIVIPGIPLCEPKLQEAISEPATDEVSDSSGLTLTVIHNQSSIVQERRADGEAAADDLESRRPGPNQVDGVIPAPDPVDVIEVEDSSSSDSDDSIEVVAEFIAPVTTNASTSRLVVKSAHTMGDIFCRNPDIHSDFWQNALRQAEDYMLENSLLDLNLIVLALASNLQAFYLSAQSVDYDRMVRIGGPAILNVLSIQYLLYPHKLNINYQVDMENSSPMIRLILITVQALTSHVASRASKRGSKKELCEQLSVNLSFVVEFVCLWANKDAQTLLQGRLDTLEEAVSSPDSSIEVEFD